MSSHGKSAFVRIALYWSLNPGPERQFLSVLNQNVTSGSLLTTGLTSAADMKRCDGRGYNTNTVGGWSLHAHTMQIQ